MAPNNQSLNKHLWL
ncbi:TPA: hypothetical protein N0F65_007623 [Lagenidium giganteum]|uniref:Uncharacterized protein n=1 Tax=Lagenidium giganteum TaxID=4803 RepID=A0AAV2Z5H5_9STRA|nr:TPA: hypothetical protein N0F65_007623 [Lagenidium giganteum]